MHVSKKRVIVFLIAISLLLLIDYSLKVREYNNLISANKSHEDTYSSYSKDTEILFTQCTTPGYVVEGNEFVPKGRRGCEGILRKSTETSVQLFVQNNQLKRSFVAPWHTNMKYAYEDLSTLIENTYEYVAGWEIDYDPDTGNNLRNNFNNKLVENQSQYNQSLMEARPFPGIFLNSGTTDLE
jgi:hypothetical protein